MSRRKSCACEYGINRCWKHSTIWADTYDRDLIDIFTIQSEVAQTIASKLTATLSPEEKKWIEAKPTDNLEAYGPGMEVNLAIVYTWTNELDLAFETLSSLKKTPFGIYYGELKLEPYWDSAAQKSAF